MSDNAHTEAVKELRQNHLTTTETLREAAALFQDVESFVPILRM